MALSSCEAEIIALSEAAKDMVYLRKFISGMTGKQIVDSSVLRTDNKAARDLSYRAHAHVLSSFAKFTKKHQTPRAAT